MGAIDLDGVSLSYGDVLAVDDVSLTVAHGEIVGLLGHNGAGKTTMLRIINGLLRPQRGRVSVKGQDPALDGHLVRATTGVLTEYPALDEYLSPAENLAVYAAINDVPTPVAAARIDTLLSQLGLETKRDVAARHLSAGLKQRVALARALVHDPQVLLLDEPTTNLDPVAARGVRELITDASRRRGRTILLCTHNLAEAEQLCDRIGIVRRGRLLSLDTPARLRRSLGGNLGVRVTTEPGQAAQGAKTLEGVARSRVVAHDVLEIAGQLATPEVVSRLVGQGIAIHRVEPDEHSLEDLYLHLHAEPLAGTRR